MNDALLPFLIENRGVRGFAVRLGGSLDAMFGWRHYPVDVRHLLSEALAATPLLAADLPVGARFNLQFQGQGALKLLVTQINSELELRGMTKFAENATGDFHALMSGGVLACMLESKGAADNYQATVEVVGESLAESLQVYFQRSEQLSTLIRLAVGADSLAGLMLQRLPEKCTDDDWHHVYTLFQTLGETELRDTDAATLLNRLFFEDRVRVFEPRPIRMQCRCSHAQISGMLLALGETEVESVLQEQGKVEVTCEFCGRSYPFSPLEVKALFAAAQVHHPSGVAH
ncbi:MAG: Hsp33 family molecular chaperone HslO [Pseudomonadota bacterium]